MTLSHRTSWQIQRAVMSALLLREIKTNFGKHRFGMIMVLIEPMLHMVAIMFMVGYVRGRGEAFVDFPVFLLVGLVPFLLFKNIALRTMDGFKAERSLLVYRQIMPMDIFIARIIIQVLVSITAYMAMLIILGWIGFGITPRDPLMVLILILVMVPFGFGLGLVLNIIHKVFPESKLFIRLSFMPLYFVSGVLHPLYVIPSELASLLLWNPLLRVVELSRFNFFKNYPMPYHVGFTYVVFLTIIFLLLGLRVYRVRSQKSART